MPREGMGEDFNQLFDRLIEERRTVRSFTEQVPSRDDIEKVIRAGLWGPYAAPAVAGTKVFRRFFVLERSGSSMDALTDIAIRTMRATGDRLMKLCESEPAMAEKAAPFAQRLQMMAASGSVALQEAPYYIVIAEKKGIPKAEQQSLAHVLENMWLKATALGMGFRLISMTEQMGHDAEFCKLLGMPPGEFAYDGCSVGYAIEWPPAPPRPTYGEAVTWLP